VKTLWLVVLKSDVRDCLLRNFNKRWNVETKVSEVPRVLLIGNYAPDGQPSMLHFADMLERGLRGTDFQARLIQPQPRLLKLASFNFVRKPLGYLDKYALFPADIAKSIDWADIVHVCDHSNAVYAARIVSKPHLVTCHDLLAVRGALGEQTYCEPSHTGKILQHWILNGLRRMRMIVCDSEYTAADAKRLVGNDRTIRTVHLGLNYPFKQLPLQTRISTLAKVPGLPLDKPFILHVGSSHPRKNRQGVLKIFSKLAKEWNGNMLFAGKPLTEELRNLCRTLNVEDRVIEIENAPEDVLEALYASAHCLLFPSRFEGFGWPIIEAQACGCPVVCSDCGPFPELILDSALMHHVDDENGFAHSVLSLNDPACREALINRGLENVKRFSTNRMIEEYKSIYRELTAGIP
jgi:glycosyltransferase involved in cell wall biosynthesis